MRCNACRIEIDHEGWCPSCDLAVHPPQPARRKVKGPKPLKVEEEPVGVKAGMYETLIARATVESKGRAPRKTRKAAAKK